MRRAGTSIETKIVLMVACALIVQDVVLLVLYFAGASPVSIQAALVVALAVSLLVAGFWGNTIARAVMELARAVYAARQGDTRVLTELSRNDEIAILNREINDLVIELRELAQAREDLVSASSAAGTASRVAPDLVRSSHELVVALKELKEGARAESSILRKVAGALGEARACLEQVGRAEAEAARDEVIGEKLGSLGSLSREIDTLSDQVMDEVSRSVVDEAALARAVNGLRDASRTLAAVSAEAAGPLTRRLADARAAGRAFEALGEAERRRAEAGRVAELMQRSSEEGLGSVSRLSSTLRRLGIVLESYEAALRRSGGGR